MLQSTLKSRTLLWLGTALACGTLIISPIRAEAQGYQRALSPAARQTLGDMLAGVPPYEQQLILNAIWALGPRAEMQLAQVRATPPAAPRTASHRGVRSRTRFLWQPPRSA